MSELLQELESASEAFLKAVFSSPMPKPSDGTEKISIRKIIDPKQTIRCAVEIRKGTQAFHQTLNLCDFASYAHRIFKDYGFRQINLFFEDREITFRISKKGKIAKSIRHTAEHAPAPAESHNREKNYLIRPGDPVPFLVDLGIFTKEYKTVASKYDKFRQINRFAEILDHAFSDFEKDEISILDFGCGKSYLTFLIYYYFSVLKRKKVHIIGYDLKKDVVEHCNELAKKYGYHGLSFVVADVTKDPLSDAPIDFVISLHACDVATDYALNFALDHNVPYLFSVPCCQHEIMQSIHSGQGELDLFLDHGLIKERMCALMTDAFRARILESEGYRVDLLEFVDFAHSPKNLMIRAKRKSHGKKKSLEALFELERTYSFRQTLLHLRTEEKS